MQPHECGGEAGRCPSCSRNREKGWSLMIFCAHATRGRRMMRRSRQTVLLARRAPTIKRWSLDARSEEQSAYSFWGNRGIRRPSPGLMARPGGPVGRPVRKLRAVEDQSAPIPRETRSELGPYVNFHVLRQKSRKTSCLLLKWVLISALAHIARLAPPSTDAADRIL
jgi:hypothetical protein